ncbi:uncharacterized protein LOC111404896 [Olea europaea var. sylvestris]|uniref:uncharacterized protein LOC111404896 n=1 Tax=Olea europaea var. sylvestris TaxID=158386 RepID=UPI000C1D6767|nr:uncharacterized protein LOC111404896 [Olea europaea var. sylvestris]
MSDLTSLTPSQLINDLTSPYFLTPAADNPGDVLVPDLLTGENYAAWKRSMRMALNAKNKLVFVDGTLKRPPDANTTNLWDRCSDMVLSWLLNSIDSNHPRLYRLQRDLANLKQNVMSIATYYNTIKGIWDEINALTDANSCTCDARKKAEDTASTERLF